MILDPADTERCSCGSYGCLERLVSIARLRKRIATDPPPADSPLAKLAPEAVTLNHLFFASQQEDPYARAYVTYLADCFSTLLRNVALVFNPEKVVFVGDYAIADRYFDRRMWHNFQQFHYLASSAPMEVRYDTRLLPELDARGGAIAMLDHFFSDPTLYEDTE
jgi:predicted NBD/HSP70 family sugar kinase